MTEIKRDSNPNSGQNQSSSSGAASMDTSALEQPKASRCEWLDGLAVDQRNGVLEVATIAASVDSLREHHSHSIAFVAFPPQQGVLPVPAPALLCAANQFLTSDLMSEHSSFRDAILPHMQPRWIRDRSVCWIQGEPAAAWRKPTRQVKAFIKNAIDSVNKLKIFAILVHSDGKQLFLHSSSSAQAARKLMESDLQFCTAALGVKRQLPPVSITLPGRSTSAGSSSSSSSSIGAKRAADTSALPASERALKQPRVESPAPAAAQAVELPRFEQYYAAALKFLVSPALVVISSTLDDATSVRADAFTLPRKFADNWLCDCNTWRQQQSCDHILAAQRLEIEGVPLLTLEEAKEMDVLPVSPNRIWLAGGASYKQHIVVANNQGNRIQVRFVFAPHTFIHMFYGPLPVVEMLVQSLWRKLSARPGSAESGPGDSAAGRIRPNFAAGNAVPR